MARVSQAELTLIDVTDGENPLTAYVTDNNHTFLASETGVISGISGFQSTPTVFVGSSSATYTTTSTTFPRFTITAAYTSAGSTGWQTPSIDASTGKITVSGIATNAVSTSVVIVVTFSIIRSAVLLTPVVVTQDISLNYVTNGAGGQVINMAPSGNSFLSNNAGALVSGQDDYIISVEAQGNTGDFTYATSIDGAAYVTKTTIADTAGNIKGFDIDTTGTFTTTAGTSLPVAVARLLFSANNLGNANSTVTVKITGANGGSSYVGFLKVKEGATGADSLLISVSSNLGNTFQNSAGTAKILTCDVRDASDGVIMTSGVSYTWTRNGTPPVAVRVNSETDRTVVASGGVAATGTAYKNITVGPEDVDGSERFGCIATVT
tara:strand:+ start:2716 stop:3852 length:1137 start_codon:yes stop_codon:yes gene_type:complete